jgi:sigma-B regulation protein RsbU (phosphoserine phosphatase)
MRVEMKLNTVAPVTLLLVLGLLSPTVVRGQGQRGPELTQEERAWLESQGRIRVGPAPNFPPVEFFDETGEYRGIVADYVALFEERLGIEFEIVRLPTWNDVVERTIAGEIDVWFEAAATDERSEYLLFTEPYLRLPSVIIVRTEQTGLLVPADLAGRRVAAGEGYAVVDYLRDRVPGIDIIEVPSVEAGLQRVSFGSVDALVAGAAVASFYIEQLGLTNLRVAGESGWEWELSIGSRNDWPILHDILRKTLDDIGFDERRAIYRRWVSLEQPESGILGVPSWVAWLVVPLVLVVVAGLLRSLRIGAAGIRLEGARTGWPVYTAATVAIVALVAGTWVAESRIAERMKRDVGGAIQTVLGTTSEAVYHWFREREEEALVWSGHLDIQLACRALSPIASSPVALASSIAQADLREQMGPLVEERDHLGYLMLTPDGLVLGSGDEAMIGGRLDTPSITELLTRIVEGPRYAGVGLPQREIQDAGSQAATMLVGAAVIEDDGTVPCVLAFLIDPESDFTQILQRGRIGESGESYAFNQEGWLISRSRFEEDLRRIGLITSGEHGILNVQVRNPGGNLVQGYRPETPRGEQPLTLMAESATSGRSEANLDGYNDYRGVPVIGAWVWDETTGLGITTEIDVSEAYGSLRWVRRMFAGGAVTGVALVLALTVMFSVDSARRRKAELQLARQSAALEATVDGIAITDPQGTIRWVNPAFSALTGYSLDEVEGQNPRALKSGKHDQSFYENMWRTISSGQVWSGELVNRRKDGSLYNEEMSITPVLNDDGEIVDYVAVKRNITERKQMEEELERARKRMEDELNVGREIQMSMLPLIFPPYPRRDDFAVHANLVPAREVGGDFYDFFLIDEDRFCFCVGDVSGKGVPAALFMAVTKTLIESRARNDSSPASILTHVNNEISRHNEACMFVTILLGILDLRTGELSYSNAGHDPPYLKSKDGSLGSLDERHGPVIGAMDGVVYGEGRADLSRGDQLLLFTDGVTEAMDETRQLYSRERLTRMLSARDFESVEALVRATVDDVWRFQGDAEQADDVTVLAVQYIGEAEDEVRAVLELTIDNRLGEIERLNGRFNEFAEQHRVLAAARRSANLVFDELLNNIISYAFDDEDDHSIGVRVELARGRLAITITDDGKPFNPFGAKPPNMMLSIEEQQIGSLGIHLVRNMMDEVSYNRRTNENEVILVKYLNSETDV